MPSNMVFALAQTPDGYLWVATEGGLARFDGDRFAEIDVTLDGEFPGAFVDMLEVSRDGTLWARLNDGVTTLALLRRIEDGWQVARRYGQSGGVGGIASTSDGAVWLLNSEGPRDLHVLRMHGEQTTRFEVPSAAFDVITCTAMDVCWVGTNSGTVARIDGGEVTLLPFDYPVGAPSGGFTRSIAEDAFGRVWMGTDDGIHLWNGEAFERYEGHTRATWHIVPTASGELWVAGSDRSWARLDLRPSGSEGEGIVDAVHSLSLATSGTRDALLDAEGNVWFGLPSTGLIQLRRDVFPAPRYGPDTRLNPLTSITFGARDAESVWQVEFCRAWVVGPDGVRRSVPEEPRDDPDRNILPADPDCILAVAADSEGSLWFLKGFNGVTRVRDDGVTHFTYPPEAPDYTPEPGETFYDHFRWMTVDALGRPWYVRQGVGLVSISPTGEQTVYPAPRGAFPFVMVLRPGVDGEIWYAGWEGFGRFSAGEYEFWSSEDWLSGAAATDIHVDPDGLAWVASDGAGVLLVDDQPVARLTRQDGLDDDRILRIIETDAGDLWLGSHRGLMIVSRAEAVDYLNGGTPWLNVGAVGPGDGVPGFRNAQASAVVAPDGKIWLVVGGGVVVADPAEVELNDTAPRLIAEEVASDGVLLAGAAVLEAPDQTVVVPADHRSIEIRYTVATFDHPERVRFRYLLEGQDDDWVEAGNRRLAAYTNLWPGEYTFRVAARKNFGPWVEREFTLRVMPHWWQTAWFAAFVVLSLVGLGAAIQTARSAAVRRRNVELQREIDARNVAEVELKGLSQRMVSAQEEDRARIARDLHDDISQRLQAAAIGVEPAIRAFRDAPEDAEKRLHDVQDQLDAVAQDTRRMSHELHPAMLEMLGFTAALEGLCEEFGIAADVETSVEVGDDVEAALGPQAALGLYRITQEALRNVDKHAEADQVNVSLTMEGSRVRMRVTDDGQGFEAGGSGVAPSGLGVASMRERARLLNGSLRVDSTPGAGTGLLVELPIEKSS